MAVAALAAIMPLGPAGHAAPASAAAAASGASYSSDAAGAAGAAGGGRVLSDDVALTVGGDGIVHARETIAYDFAGSRSIERSFVTKIRATETRDRVFAMSGLTAASPDGGPAGLSVSHEGDRTIVRLSAPGALTGRHTVTLRYDVRGAVIPMGHGQELRWTAIGGWHVPVEAARVTVDAASVVQNINCFAGPLGSVIGCTQFFTNHTHTRGEFSQEQMLPGDYLTVVVGYPAGMTKGAPIYAERRTLATSFSVNAVTGGSLLGLLVLLLGGLALVYQLRGRDARAVVQKAAEGDHPPVTGQEGGASAFQPPDGVRPGQIGTLIDEQADVIDVTATIVDLAVRGYLLIEEEDKAVTGRLDWVLRKLDRPQPDLRPYERILLGALFAGRDSVKLSELGGTFSDQLAKVRDAMYDDVVAQGWFARRPDRTRTWWTTAGMVLTFAGVVGTVVLAVFTNLALIGLAVIIAGAALTAGGQYMPAKTAKGSTVLAHMIGFRAYLARGEAAEAADVGERQRISMFSRYLPYAVVFDSVEKWAKTVEDAGVREAGADNLYWYEGPAEWDLSKFAESMRIFTLATSGAISQTRQFRTI